MVTRAAALRRQPATAVMMDLIAGFQVSKLIHAVIRLGVADALARKPLDATTLAARVGAHAPFLYRTLRCLACVDIFREDRQHRFALTRLGRTLCKDQRGSVRNMALMLMDDCNWRTWGALLDGIRSGDHTFMKVHGATVFDYLGEHPEDERVFNAAMTGFSIEENALVARAYPFSRHRFLVDVGGGNGHLLNTLLRRHRKLHALLYDQPPMIASARAAGFITDPAVASRIATTGGDFFKHVPIGADAYLLKHITHDWTDEENIRILKLCRAGLRPGGRVLVVEHVIEAGNGYHMGKIMDSHMMLIGGRERTRGEFRGMLAEAGLTLRRIHPTASLVSVLEAAALSDPKRRRTPRKHA